MKHSSENVYAKSYEIPSSGLDVIFFGSKRTVRQTASQTDVVSILYIEIIFNLPGPKYGSYSILALSAS